MNRLLVSAAHKSSGKTTVTLGLCAALTAQGTTVQPYKKGPDYIDPMWLSAAAGRPCFNLDPHLRDDAALQRCFVQGLAVAIAEQVDKDQDKPVPVVRLKKEHYQHKSYGRIFTPVFDIVKWSGMDAAPAEEDAEEAEAPAEDAPRRRRRV